jgi:hypothetical protein
MAGFIDVHNFYARQWLASLLQLLPSVATFLTPVYELFQSCPGVSC